MGCPDAALAGEFPDRSRPFRLGPGGDPRPRHGQEGGGAGQCDARGIAAADGRRHRHGRRRGHRRQARPRVPARRVPDRLRHANQHERQRGHRPSRQPRRRGRHPPQRRRQPQPVLERRLSGGDAHCRRRDGRRPAAAGACRVARRARRARPDARPDRRHRAHPSDGRDAADAGAGVFRLDGAARPGGGDGPRRARRALRAAARRHRGRHRAQRAGALRRARRRADRRRDRPAVPPGRQFVRARLGA